MKFFQIFVLVIFTGLVSCQGNDHSPADNLSRVSEEPKTETERISYALGNDIGFRMRQDSVDIDVRYFVEGMIRAKAGDTTLIPLEEMSAMMQAFSEKMMNKQNATMAEQNRVQVEEAKRNKEEYPAFMEQNAKKEGVTVTPEGLQYEVLKAGSGKIPSEDDVVKVHLIARLKDGKEFDNTYIKDPLEFPVNTALPGWQIALKKMKIGSKWRLVIPPDLAFGEMGVPPNIPGYSIIIFDLELVDIVGKAADWKPKKSPQQPRMMR